MRNPTSIVRTLGVWLLVAAGSVTGAPSPPELKLPDSVVPSRYELQLTLDPDADEYSGTIGIEVRIAAPTGRSALPPRKASTSRSRNASRPRTG